MPPVESVLVEVPEPTRPTASRASASRRPSSRPLDWVDVDPADRSAVERISGQPLVPVLELDGRVIPDSTAIIEEVERLHPDPPLYPADRARREEVETFVDWFNRVWKRPPNELEAELTKPDPDRRRPSASARRSPEPSVVSNRYWTAATTSSATSASQTASPSRSSSTPYSTTRRTTSSSTASWSSTSGSTGAIRVSRRGSAGSTRAPAPSCPSLPASAPTRRSARG